MNRREINRREALLRVNQFLIDYPLTQPNARVATLRSSLTGVIAEIEAHGDDQETGRGLARGGTAECRRIASELRALMRQISDISKVVDPGEFPGVAQQLRMPGNSYVSLETRARAFVEVVAPIKSAFVDRMMPEDFDEELQGLIEAFAQARDRKYSGRAEQVGGTAGIAEAIRRGMRLARELDAILSVAHAKSPALLAPWKSALRPRREPDSSAISTPAAAANARSEVLEGLSPAAFDVADSSPDLQQRQLFRSRDGIHAMLPDRPPRVAFQHAAGPGSVCLARVSDAESLSPHGSPCLSVAHCCCDVDSPACCTS
jgi:hypothetical protein